MGPIGLPGGVEGKVQAADALEGVGSAEVGQVVYVVDQTLGKPYLVRCALQQDSHVDCEHADQSDKAFYVVL